MRAPVAAMCLLVPFGIHRWSHPARWLRLHITVSELSCCVNKSGLIAGGEARRGCLIIVAPYLTGKFLSYYDMVSKIN